MAAVGPAEPEDISALQEIAFYERLDVFRLSPDEITPALRERVCEETERGLSPDIRIAMHFYGASGGRA
ncbi:MAG: hypothetical protein JXO72_01700 [Vicinamibacteria bacterium]|nr:hypothetical protein [Vicinamibacteria bacterium]